MIYFQFHTRTGQSCQVYRRATAVHKASSHGRLLHFRGECLHLFSLISPAYLSKISLTRQPF